MYLWLIFDAVILFIFAFCIHRAMKKGLINASKSILSVILTIIIMSSSHSYITAWFKTSQIGEAVRENITSIVSESYQTDSVEKIQAEEKNGLPSLFDSFIKEKTADLQKAQEELVNSLAQQITDVILSVLALILMYVAIRIFVFILIKILGLVFELPLLKSVNKLFGAVIGIVNALFFIYIIMSGLVLFAPQGSTQIINEAIQASYITKFFYDNNLLLGLFI